MAIEKVFRVVNVRSMGEKVSIALKEISRVEPGPPYPEYTDEMTDAIVDATVRAFSAIGLPVQSGRIEIPDIVVNLTYDEFVKLGRPSVGDIFRMKIEREESENINP